MRYIKLSLAAATLLVSFSGASFASDADFKLANRTGYQIDEVYVAPFKSNKWGKDIMGTGSLGDGESVNISFPHGGGACIFDISVKYNDGDKAEWANIDLCQYEKISLFWDGKTTRAVGE